MILTDLCREYQLTCTEDQANTLKVNTLRLSEQLFTSILFVAWP